MLTKHDIKFMEDTVSEIVTDWEDNITILVPLPIGQQNYNTLMREIIGKMKYNKILISAERKYLVNNYDDSLEVNSAGPKDEGVILYSIPARIDGKEFKPTLEYMLIFEDSLFRIRSVRERIGETLITFDKNTGVNINSVDIVGDVIL